MMRAKQTPIGEMQLIAPGVIMHRIREGVTVAGSDATIIKQVTEELAAGIRIHPTFSEAVVDAARDAEKWALYLPKK